MSAPTNREIAEVARAAAEIIQARGKATGTPEDAKGRVCTHHALVIAGGLPRQIAAPILRLLEAEARPLGVAQWSDLSTEAVIAKTFLRIADEIEVAP